MTFKENLLKKIRIDEMSKRVSASIGPPDSDQRIDKKLMQNLLSMSLRKAEKVRDLELYVLESESEKKNILVLDNELPIYLTTVSDVALRKSPTVKEMVSFTNIRKILNDKDIVVTKKAASVEAIQKECIERLDLVYSADDIRDIENDGRVSLEKAYSDGVMESLTLFAELLDYQTAPRAFRLADHQVIGSIKTADKGRTRFGPIVMYNRIHNKLKLIVEKRYTDDPDHLDHFQQVARGKKEPDREGSQVLEFLTDSVLSMNRQGLKG